MFIKFLIIFFSGCYSMLGIAETVPVVDGKANVEFLDQSHKQRFHVTSNYKGFSASNTATNTVQNLAEEVLHNLDLYLARSDGRNAVLRLKILSHLANMKVYYDEWRSSVLAQTGTSAKYLEGYNTEDYENLIAIMLRDKIYGEKNRDLLQARNIYVNLLLDLAFLPNKYCKVESIKDENISEIIELSLIRDILYVNGSSAAIYSCSHAEVRKYLANNDLKLIQGKNEIGHFLKGGRFSLDPNRSMQLNSMNKTKDHDFSGTSFFRAHSATALTTRTNLFNSSLNNIFSPSMLDEPDIRDLVKKVLISRAVNGVQLRQTNIINSADVIASEKSKNSEFSGEIYQNYQEEKLLIEFFYQSFFDGLEVPKNTLESDRRRDVFLVKKRINVNEEDLIGTVWYKLENFYLYSQKEENVSAQLIETLLVIKRQLENGSLSKQLSRKLVGEKRAQASLLLNLILMSSETP